MVHQLSSSSGFSNRSRYFPRDLQSRCLYHPTATIYLRHPGGLDWIVAVLLGLD